MAVKDIQKKNVGDLKKELGELRERVRTFRFNTISGKGNDLKEMREAKKDIARILTELKART